MEPTATISQQPSHLQADSRWISNFIRQLDGWTDLVECECKTSQMFCRISLNVSAKQVKAHVVIASSLEALTLVSQMQAMLCSNVAGHALPLLCSRRLLRCACLLVLLVRFCCHLSLILSLCSHLVLIFGLCFHVQVGHSSFLVLIIGVASER